MAFIDITDIQTITSFRGQQSVSTLGGQIALEQGRGRLAIYDPVTKQPRNVQDVTGTHIYDENGNELTRLDILGLTTIEPSTGDYKVRVGAATDDGRVGVWVAEPGVDLRDEGI